MSKTYIVNTKIDIVTVQADSAIEAIKMVAEGRKIKNFDGKLTIRKSYDFNFSTTASGKRARTA